MKGATALLHFRLPAPGLSVLEAWTLFADTHLLNVAVGNPEVELCNVPVRPGVARRIISTTRLTPALTYEEDHYQWDFGRWVGGERWYYGLPLEKFMFLFAMEPTADGAVADVQFGFWGSRKEVTEAAAGLKEGMRAVAEQLLQAQKLERLRFFSPAAPPPPVDSAQLGALTAALLDSGESASVVRRLVRHLEAGGDDEVVFMRPLALASDWKLGKDAVTDAFIRGARLGMLLPEWSVACPSCRGPKGTTQDVAQLARREIHCADCNISFDADPTTNIALTFKPAPELRRIEETFNCIAAPTRTPHIQAQSYVPAGAKLVVSTLLEGDLDRHLSCPDTGASVHIKAGGLFSIDPSGSLRQLEERADSVEVINQTSERVRVRLEDRRIPDTFLRASEVLARPRFRELFAADQWEFLCDMEAAWRAAFGNASLQRGSAEPQREFDLIVVGAGPGGEAVALRAAQLGQRVALIESSPIFGGPSGLASKAMREAVRKILGWADGMVSDRLADADERRARLGALFEERFASTRKYVAILQMQDILEKLSRAGVSLFHGRASFDAGGAVAVRRSEDSPPLALQGKQIVIATGSRPARPAHLPFDSGRVLDAVTMGAIKQLPRHLCIVGSGVIACEFATILAAIGVRVTILGGGRRPFGYLDAELLTELRRHMQEAGIDLQVDAHLRTVTVERDGVRVTLEDGAVLTCDAMLYAEGRVANSDQLGCEVAGIELGEYGRIRVSSEYRSNHPKVFAIGDVIGPPGLASAAVAQGKELAERLFGQRPGIPAASTQHPTTLWTVPEVAAVGMTEERAKHDGADAVVGRALYRNLPRGIVSGDRSGWLKLLADRASHRILGAHIIGEGACDLIQFGRGLIESGGTLESVVSGGFSAMTYHTLFAMAAEDALLAARRAPAR